MGTLTKMLAVAATLMLGTASFFPAEATGKATAKATVEESGDESGLSGLHAQKPEGRHICMSEHSHHGASAGHPTKKIAEAEAINSWAGFTAFEYGAVWGDYSIAASKTMQCSQSDSGSWGCELDARPCKRSAAATKGRKRVKKD
jgi:hypothetical protein